MSDLMQQLQSEAESLSTMPSDAGVARLRKAAQRLVELDRLVDMLDEELKQAKKDRWDLQTRELPDLFAELNTDRIGLPDEGVDVVSKPFVQANIAADWEPERREAAFEHLDSVGGADIVKNVVKFEFSRGHADEMDEFLEKVRGLNFSFEPPQAEVTKTVPWNTLTAFVREQVRAGTVLDLEKLGATVGTKADIKKRG